MARPMGMTRRRFLELLISVAVLHAVAIALYYSLDVAHLPPARQRIFAWIWMGATVAVVLTGLQRLKRARRSTSRVNRGP